MVTYDQCPPHLYDASSTAEAPLTSMGKCKKGNHTLIYQNCIFILGQLLTLSNSSKASLNSSLWKKFSLVLVHAITSVEMEEYSSETLAPVTRWGLVPCRFSSNPINGYNCNEQKLANHWRIDRSTQFLFLIYTKKNSRIFPYPLHSKILCCILLKTFTVTQQK